MNEKEYEDLVDMFATPGWKYFVEGIKELEQALTQVAPDAADTNNKWQFARGQIQQLRRVGGYEDYVVLSREAQVADDVDPV